jgi:aspartyl-tRNA(Asn)/glutamyl-tRNA(Gln) amidotransferase subunit A
VKVAGKDIARFDMICAMSVAERAAAVRRGEVTARQSVEASLARIAALDRHYHAFCTVDEDGALAMADEIDRRLAAGETVGPLAGVPVGIKDLICTRGLRTTFGSLLYADYIPDEDDVAVSRLRAAGAIVVGKTNTSEFGYGAVGYNALFAPTLNPWNANLSPGGSSAGSAVAVATSMVPLALGSDGGGSIRVPASLCGLIGLKPSWGRVPLYPGCRDERLPGASGWESLEHIGPLCRSAVDAALAMSVLAGPAPRDRHSLPRDILSWSLDRTSTKPGLRMAFSVDMGLAKADSEIIEIAELAVAKLEQKLNAPIIRTQPRILDPQPHFEALVALETDRAGLRRMAAERSIGFGPALSRLLARDWSAEQFTQAILARKSIVNAMWPFMEAFDFLLTPTTAAAAFPSRLDAPQTIGGEPAGRAGCAPLAAIANFTGQPAASTPIGMTSDGRPVGLQILGRHQDDLGVLATCAIVEELGLHRSWSQGQIDRENP